MTYTFCVECGPEVKVDEDGCCEECGRDAVGEWAQTAVSAIRHCGGSCYKRHIDGNKNGNSSESD